MSEMVKKAREIKKKNLISLCYLRELKVKCSHLSFLAVFFSPTEVHISRHMRRIKHPNRKSDHHKNKIKTF